jgi:hypothetical protein
MVPDLLPPTKEMEALSEAILPDLFAALDYIRNNKDRKAKDTHRIQQEELWKVF